MAVPGSTAEPIRLVVAAAARVVRAGPPHPLQAARAVPGLHRRCLAAQSPTRKAAAGRVNQTAVWVAVLLLGVTVRPIAAAAVAAGITVSLAARADRES
jgi:hypothetical protein